MKATRIVISVIVSCLLVLLTTTEAAEDVLDYKTNLPIRLKDGCYMSAAIWQSVFDVNKTVGDPFLYIQWGRRPHQPRSIKLHPFLKSDGNIKTETRYYIRFSDSQHFWYGNQKENRIAQGAVRFREGGFFWFVKDRGSRFYKMRYEFGDVYEVGVHASTESDEYKYYLGLMESSESRIQKDPGMEHLLFLLEKA